MKCPKCRASIDDGLDRCTFCGNYLHGSMMEEYKADDYDDLPPISIRQKNNGPKPDELGIQRLTPALDEVLGQPRWREDAQTDRLALVGDAALQIHEAGEGLGAVIGEGEGVLFSAHKHRAQVAARKRGKHPIAAGHLCISNQFFDQLIYGQFLAQQPFLHVPEDVQNRLERHGHTDGGE